MRLSLLAGLPFLSFIFCVPQLERTLLKSGFHRDLQTIVRIPETDIAIFEDVECSILLTETLPSGAYVDPYQLNTLKPYGGPDVVVLDQVDVEKPEFESQDIKVLIFSNISLINSTWVGEFSLPIHIRYHSVSEKSFVSLTLSNPEIALRCVNLQLGMVHYGYQGESIRMTDEVCDSNRNLLCDWTVIQYHTERDSVTVDVPVGRRGDYILVTAGTVLTTLFGCFLLTIKTLHTDLKTKES